MFFNNYLNNLGFKKKYKKKLFIHVKLCFAKKEFNYA